jgi:formate dehydrogenase
MAKVVCVLYDDPIDGYPPKYARDNTPRSLNTPTGRPHVLAPSRGLGA